MPDLVTDERVGFCGTGTMGAPMAANLVAAGLEVQVWNRTEAKTEQLVRAGALACSTPGETAVGARAVITMLWDETAVDEVLFGKGGIVERADPGAVVIDMSTTSPKHARRCADRLVERELGFLDAPVSGARPRAEAGTLALMVGGDAATFAAVRDLLEPTAATIEHVGPTGAGQLVKLAGNVIGFGTVAAVCEGLGLIAAAGGDLKKALQVIAKGTAQSEILSVYGPLLLRGQLDGSVTVAVARKDLQAALDAAAEAGIELPGSRELALRYASLVERGEGHRGCQAIFGELGG